MAGSTDYTGGGFVNQEASAIIQFAGNCQRSDEVTIRHWGPAHHDVLCCWEIATVNQSGQVGLQSRRKPHPNTTKPKPERACANLGSIRNGRVGIKVTIWKTATGGYREVRIDTTASRSSWKKGAPRDFTQWGAPTEP